MEIVYYCYHHGEYEFEEKLNRIFKTKDYNAFVALLEEEQKEGQYCRLPKTATLFRGYDIVAKLDITEKAVFENAKIECEWG